MTYYAIETRYVPTEKNDRKDACEHFYFTGKAGYSLDTESCLGNGNMANNRVSTSDYDLQHAYTRLCDAKRALKSRQELNEWEEKYGWWNVTSRIITIEK